MSATQKKVALFIYRGMSIPLENRPRVKVAVARRIGSANLIDVIAIAIVIVLLGAVPVLALRTREDREVGATAASRIASAGVDRGHVLEQRIHAAEHDRIPETGGVPVLGPGGLPIETVKHMEDRPKGSQNRGRLVGEKAVLAHAHAIVAVVTDAVKADATAHVDIAVEIVKDIILPKKAIRHNARRKV